VRERSCEPLVKLCYILNSTRQSSDLRWTKACFTVSYLKNAAFNWVGLKLHEFLDKTSKKWMNNKKFIFNNYKKFKNELWRVFKIVDKKWAAENDFTFWRWTSTVKYAAEFQWITALMNWKWWRFSITILWGLNETIKDEIVRMINLKSSEYDHLHQHQQLLMRTQMKCTEHYTSKVWERHYTLMLQPNQTS
jgi:hypothetical protein